MAGSGERPDDGLTRSAFLRRAGLATSVVLGPVALAGCRGGTGRRSPRAGSPSTGPAGGVEPRRTGGATAGGVDSTISFLGWDLVSTGAGLGRGLAAARTAWEAANPGSAVIFDGVPPGGFLAVATDRARAGELADVVELLPDAGHAALFPAVEALRRSAGDGLGTDLSGWSSAVLDPADPEGFAGVPLGVQGTIWYYNKALFERAGLDAARPPETWAEFGTVADALHVAGIVPIGMSGDDSVVAWWAWCSFSPQGFPTPADVLDVRAGRTRLDDPRVLRTLEPLRESYVRGWWNPWFRETTRDAVEAAFSAGQVGMVPGLLAGPLSWQQWDTTLGKDGYGVFAAPALGSARPGRPACGASLVCGISRETRHHAAARSWVAFLASAAGQTILLEEARQLPNRRDVDIGAVTGSPGAAAIGAILGRVEGVGIAQNEFSGAARATALEGLTDAIVGGDLEGFLADLAGLQTGA